MKGSIKNVVVFQNKFIPQVFIRHIDLEHSTDILDRTELVHLMLICGAPGGKNTQGQSFHAIIAVTLSSQAVNFSVSRLIE